MTSCLRNTDHRSVAKARIHQRIPFVSQPLFIQLFQPIGLRTKTKTTRFILLTDIMYIELL